MAQHELKFHPGCIAAEPRSRTTAETSLATVGSWHVVKQLKVRNATSKVSVVRACPGCRKPYPLHHHPPNVPEATSSLQLQRCNRAVDLARTALNSALAFAISLS